MNTGVKILYIGNILRAYNYIIIMLLINLLISIIIRYKSDISLCFSYCLLGKPTPFDLEHLSILNVNTSFDLVFN